jgi:hypothetical protein
VDWAELNGFGDNRIKDFFFFNRHYNPYLGFGLLNYR